MSGPVVVLVGGRQLASMLAEAASALYVELRTVASRTDDAVTAVWAGWTSATTGRLSASTRSVALRRPRPPTRGRDAGRASDPRPPVQQGFQNWAAAGRHHSARRTSDPRARSRPEGRLHPRQAGSSSHPHGHRPRVVVRRTAAEDTPVSKYSSKDPLVAGAGGAAHLPGVRGARIVASQDAAIADRARTADPKVRAR